MYLLYCQQRFIIIFISLSIFCNIYPTFNFLDNKMQFDLINQILTQTVYDIFINQKKSGKTMQTKDKIEQTKRKVKQLKDLFQTQFKQKYRILDLSKGQIINIKDDQFKTQSKTYELAQQWLVDQAPRMLNQLIQKIGIQQRLLKEKNRPQLLQYISSMDQEKLVLQKKKLKNQLQRYDQTFNQLFSRYPSRDQKIPVASLYAYYRQIKSVIQIKNMQIQMRGKIQQLQKQKGQLKAILTIFQEEFQKKYNRKIRISRDIKPVQNQYTRYNQIKRQLLKYEQMLRDVEKM